MASKKKDLRAVVKRAEKAWNELGLSLMTQADKKRYWRIWEGLRALDDEQAQVKYAIEELLEENADLGRVSLEQIRDALTEHGITMTRPPGVERVFPSSATQQGGEE